MTPRVRLRTHLVLALLILIFGGCGGNGDDAEPTVGGNDTAQAPTASPEPELSEARLEGKWRHIRVNTRVTNKTSTSDPSLKKGYEVKFLYSMRPSCPEGPCDVTVRYDHVGSNSKGTFGLRYENGRYESRSVTRGGSCAGVEGAWKATTTLTFVPTEAEDRDGSWVATAYEGDYKQIQRPVNAVVRDAGCGPATIIGTTSGKRTD